jgi:hypothetical protein
VTDSLLQATRMVLRMNLCDAFFSQLRLSPVEIPKLHVLLRLKSGASLF